LIGELLLWSPNVLTILKRDSVLVWVVVGIRGARWGAEEMGVKVCLTVGRDNGQFIEKSVWE
jgi:hypothetical protein